VERRNKKQYSTIWNDRLQDFVFVVVPIELIDKQGEPQRYLVSTSIKTKHLGEVIVKERKTGLQQFGKLFGIDLKGIVLPKKIREKRITHDELAEDFAQFLTFEE